MNAIADWWTRTQTALIEGARDDGYEIPPTIFDSMRDCFMGGAIMVANECSAILNNHALSIEQKAEAMNELWDELRSVSAGMFADIAIARVQAATKPAPAAAANDEAQIGLARETIEDAERRLAEHHMSIPAVREKVKDLSVWMIMEGVPALTIRIKPGTARAIISMLPPVPPEQRFQTP